MNEKVILKLEYHQADTICIHLEQEIKKNAAPVDLTAKIITGLFYQSYKKFKPGTVFNYEGEKVFTISAPCALALQLTLEKGIGEDTATYKYQQFKKIIDFIKQQTL